MAHDPYQILAHPFSLDGYAVIITGAGGAIGGATAHVLAQAGANVVVSDLDLEAAEVHRGEGAEGHRARDASRSGPT